MCVCVCAQETELLSKLESQLVEHSGSATPLPSPFSVSMTTEDSPISGEAVGGGFPVAPGRHPSAAMVLAAEVGAGSRGGGGGGGWAEEEEEDVLMQDLQHSSSSENSGTEDSESDDD